MKNHLVFFLIGAIVISIPSSHNVRGYKQDKRNKAVTTLLNSKWMLPPVALEIAEYLAEEDPNYLWTFIDKVNEMIPAYNTLTKDKELYDKAIEAASTILSPLRIRIMKFSLALHSHSPIVEMFNQMAVERGVGALSCEAVADVAGQLLCDAEDVGNTIEKTDGVPRITTYDVDHHYPGSANNSITVVLYGNPGSREFAGLHKVLSRYADEGKIDYILRWYIRNPSEQYVRLSGYGVELQLKSTEYKSQDDTTPDKQQEDDLGDGDESKEDENDPANVVDGFNFAKLKNLFPALRKSLEQFKGHLLEQDTELAPLKVWQFQELSLQASESIMSAPPAEALNHFINIAQNFPMQAHNLVRIAVSPQLKNEIKHNQEQFATTLNVHPADSALFVNGMFFDMDAVDVISLLQFLKQEVTIMEGLHSLDLSKSRLSSLLNLDITHSVQSGMSMYSMGSSLAQDFALDIRDSGIMWANDLENDYQYKKWPTSYMELLRPSYLGMLKNIRRNLYNVVVVLDPVAIESRSLITVLDAFLRQNLPIRIGVGLKITSDAKVTGLQDAGVAVLCAFNYITQEKGAREAFGFLHALFQSADNKKLTIENVKKKLKSMAGFSIDLDDILGEDSDYDYGRKLTAEFVSKTGMQTFPQVLVNGIPLAEEDLSQEQFEEGLLTEIMHQTSKLQKAVYRGELSDSDDAMDYLMGQSNVMPRLNSRILSSSADQYMDMTGKASEAGFDPSRVSDLLSLTNADKTATAVKHLKYLEKKQSGKETKRKDLTSTLWIVGDLACPKTRNILKGAIEYMTSTSGVRVTFLPNVDGTTSTLEQQSLNKVVVAAINVLPADKALKYITDLLANDGCHERKDCDIIPELVPALNKQDWLLKLSRVYVNRVIGFKKAGQCGLVYNGRVLGPLEKEETFHPEDFLLLERFTNMIYGDKIKSALYPAQKPSENDVDVESDNEEDFDDGVVSADTQMKIISLLSSRPQTRTRFTLPSSLQEKHSVLKIPSTKDPALSIAAVVDPVSRSGQKMGSLLHLLSLVFDCDIKLYLNSVEKNSDMPLKSFYRFVAEPELQFNTTTLKFTPGPIAKFTHLPQSSLLTLSLDVPGNWLVQSVRSVYDLDNIRLADVEKVVHSEFELEYLLLEGHCWDMGSSTPPRGLQVTLGTTNNPTMVDTIVMANLGYFQLKANPGAWTLRLRQGRSADLYDIVGVENADTPPNSTDIKVLISSLRAHVLKMKVAKKPGMQGMDLLGDVDEKAGGIWNSITSSFSVGDGDKDNEQINIFSVASGHLYERFLRIMMLSVLKHTRSPIKFWFLKNYLSPSLKDILPYMAKEYKFDYELVEYKWPRWLHQQTEKQRIIWGYKILFLDVLFPLDVKKIIFVDADQIVRADMKELVDLDLGGAPYGYTPFCESRTEMDGFRFWKQGYWRNHLQGRRYHISALYVVDLKRFRRIAAGDRLRGQYQALSQDPNSLSNLDQDLPNNMIHQVAIKSLPQEWLWCETWCDDASKATAKTIDLCNNPMTKEAKLTAAVRIVPEWTSYDEEVKKLQQRIQKGELTLDNEESFQEDVLPNDHHEEL